MGWISMTTFAGTHGDLFAWARDLERENTRIAEINGGRVGDRGCLVFVTDPQGRRLGRGPAGLRD
jgi:hypothetical protein